LRPPLNGFFIQEPQEEGKGEWQTARTFRVPGEMLTPPPSRTIAHVGSPPTNELNRPIPTAVAVPVAIVQESSLTLLGATRALRG